MSFLFRILRGYLTGVKGDYQLNACRKPVLDGLESAGLYLHIPFCKTLCPYCPYNKVPYEAALEKAYGKAIEKEIDLVKQRVVKTFSSTSLYVGGGTPTLCMDTLEQVIPMFREQLNLQGDLCIETGADACGDSIIKRLRKLGTNMVSIGIQSFDESLLQYLGRNTSSQQLESVIQRLLGAGFDSVNCDFIFAMPGQTDRQLYYDLQRAVALGVRQITLYPLFSFPYSSVQSYRRSRRVAPPNLWQERRQFKLIKEFFDKAGFIRSSIWSFRKESVPRYSSATREQYIGFGAGAGSHVPRGFFLNTFDVQAYIDRLSGNEYPTALGMDFTRQMHQYFWFYWRLYDTYVTKVALWTMFEKEDKKINRLLWFLRKTGLLNETKQMFQLRDGGAFWVHLIQNRLLLEYINTVWGQARRKPFPETVCF